MEEPIEAINRESIRFNNNYYRNNFRYSVVALIIFILVNILLVFAITYIALTKPPTSDKFFTSNMYNSNVAPLIPLNSAITNLEKISTKVNKIVLDAFTYNFANYQEVFSNIHGSFTIKGWDSFNTAVQNSGLFNSIINNSLFAEATLADKPAILNNGVIDGRYAWNINVPLLIALKTQNAANIQQPIQHLTVNVLVVRVPNLEDPEAIAIDSFSIL